MSAYGSMSITHPIATTPSVCARAPQRESCSSSLVCMCAARLAAIALFSHILLVVLLCSAPDAFAATWPLSASSSTASLGFHQTYSAGDKSYVHSGIDIPASAGSQIVSPLAGTVRYTGIVPSGDSRVGQAASSGKTMHAVSVQIADGRTITLMPFASTGVTAGQEVAEGQVLGTLAASGDVSTAAVHLHMGLKKDGTYYDPMTLFGMSSASGSTAAAARRSDAQSSGTAASDGVTQSAAEDAGAEPSSAQAESASAADAPALGLEQVTGVETAADADVAEELGTISSGNVVWSPQEEGEWSLTTQIGALVEPLFSACANQAQDLRDAVLAFSEATGIPALAATAACAALFLCIIALAVWLAITRLIPAVGRVWASSIGPLLVQKGGDSMHKLFPASGTAFTSRSR